MSIPQISIAEYDYDLPSARIAKYPLARRDESKLLVYRQQKIEQGYFKQLSSFLPNNTLLVFNNTKVIRARLRFQKATGAQIEIFCLEPHVPTEAADRKSTRLNSSHVRISYAVFCLKKKKNNKHPFP